MWTGDPVIKYHLGFVVECHPDIAAFYCGCADFPDSATIGKRIGTHLSQRDRIGFAFAAGGRVFVDLIQNQGLDRLIGQLGRRGRPGHVDRHVLQVDAHHRRIILDPGQVTTQPGGTVDHRLNAVFTVILGGVFIGKNIKHRAGPLIDGGTNKVMGNFRAADLGSFAQDDGLHAGEGGCVHNAGEVGRGFVAPGTGQRT